MKHPRVILVKPPEESQFDFGAFSLGVLAAFIRDISEPVIIDATKQSYDEAVEQVWSLKPDLVGITVMGLGSIQSALEFLRLLASDKSASKTKILVGGHGAACAPEDFLKSGASAVIIGEGELTLKSIIKQGIEPGAPGIICIVDDKLVAGSTQSLINPLDQLLPPARDLMPYPRDGIHLMETSRGCPHQCTFCETTRFYNTTWRAFSPEWVAAEVARLVEDYNAWMILFTDDNFAASSPRVLKICERLSRGSLPAAISVSVRADDLIRNPAVIPALAKANILRVTVGVETLEPEVAKAVGKSIPLPVYREAFTKLRAHGIYSVASIITGLPGQRYDASTSVELVVETGPDAAVFVPFIPMPGTPLAEGHMRFKPSKVDQENAQQMNTSFYQHDDVRKRLSEAEASGGIRGLMAKATASHHNGTS